MSRRSIIGFDRRIEREWLDFAAGRAVAGDDPHALRQAVHSLLAGSVSGDGANSARGKTTTVLARIWGGAAGSADEVSSRAILLFADANEAERLALHWGLMLATYPVFADVAATAGRLLALQSSFTLSHLTRRMISTWGERSTLTRAVQRIVRSMVSWGVLHDAGAKGTYQAGRRIDIGNRSVARIVAEAILTDSDDAAVPISTLLNHPARFPFNLNLSSGDLRAAPPFLVHREGLDSELVELAKQVGADLPVG